MNCNTNFLLLVNSSNDQLSKITNNSNQITRQKLINLHTNNILSAFPKSKIIIVGDIISIDKQSNKKIKYINMYLDEYSNMGALLKRVNNEIDEKKSLCIMTYSLMFDIWTLKNLNMKTTSMVSCCNKNFESKIGCTKEIETNHIISICYDIECKLYEMIYLHHKDISKFKEILKMYVRKYMYLFEVINIMIQNNFKIKLHSTKHTAIHLDNTQKFRKAVRLFSKLQGIKVK